MACGYNFPAQAPVGCALELATMFRAGTLLSQKGKSLQIVGQVIGQAGSMMTDVPTFGAVADEDLPNTLEGCCDRIEQLQQASAHNPAAMQANPLLAALLAKFAAMIIAKILGL